MLYRIKILSVILYKTFFKHMKRKLFLIGFMGSGKSTLGKLLSEKLNISHFDLDIFIEKEEKESIVDIFRKNGEMYFRNLEKKYLKKLIAKENFIISTGGGTPIHNKMMELMLQNGTVIYLKCSESILFDRLKENKNKRPLLSNLSQNNLQNFITKTLTKREEIYEKSEKIFFNNNKKDMKRILNTLR